MQSSRPLRSMSWTRLRHLRLLGRPGRHRRWISASRIEKSRDNRRSRPSSIRPCWLSQSPVGYGIEITSDTSPSSLASFAAGSQRMPTIYALRKAPRSVVRSVMNSPCHCAGATIARSTAAATNPCWLKVRINPMVTAAALWLKTHPLPAGPAHSRVGATEPAASA